ncbi:MAG: molybdopterin molybdenumtransferase MoeA, partial [Ruminococcaceae bacterium]|nr:molybdopterin molybdenumtransferase MoeA [Oscillospiraceae bacterium]
MLKVITPAQAINIINSEFKAAKSIVEQVELDFAVGRILAEDIISDEYVPDFDRSTVDGYALHAADTFGCSEAVPAILNLHAEVQMGKAADFILPKGSCSPVPTGGAVPKGVDCVLMIEHAEDYKDGTIGATIPMAAGRNMIYRGDDVQPGKIILSRGRRLKSQDIGALAAIGKSVVPVCR